MKILICFHPINNPGGILNNQEGLYTGLKELGHSVDVRLLVWKTDIRTAESSRHLTPERGVMGMKFDQELGWYWPANMRIPYKGKANLNRWKGFASRYDLIIWQIPVPTMQRDHKGNLDWLELYNVPVKQIAYVHDGNMEDSYPWIYAIVDKLCGVAGTHPCAYHSCAKLPIPRALAFTAQKDIKSRIEFADTKRETARDGWFSLQTFKGWKHVEDIVRAVPYMGSSYPKVLAGGGIGMYYMTSQDKLKPAFIASKEYDPDIPETHVGQRIWDLAISYGMAYHGYLTNTQREQFLSGAKFLIDPSWSKKYAGIGDHINRTPIDGLIGGAVPIARNFGVATSVDGIGEFFKPDRSYVMIPWDATPKQFAEIVNDAMNMPESRRQEMLEAGRAEVVPHFDHLRVAQTFIDLAAGKPAGVYKRENDVGRRDNFMVSESEKALKEFFGTP